jgi:ribonuclease-3 family protein
MRGRNTHTKSKAKNADMMEYRYSTGLEALFGYLYLMKQEERLMQLWEQIKIIGESL